MTRLDVALVQAGHARSRSQAAELIRTGRVSVNGGVVRRASHRVTPNDELITRRDPWVSRAAHKLIGALDESGLRVTGRALDAGASTGGFTQVLLAHGAEVVYAVDVGHGQLVDQLRADARVRVREGLNLRDLELADVDGQQVDLAVADVSFISLRMLLEPILGVVSPQGKALLMIKPQFEVGRERLGAGGVVRDRADRASAIAAVLADAAELGWHPTWRGDSRLAGPAGNLEHFALLQRGVSGMPGAAHPRDPTAGVRR